MLNILECEEAKKDHAVGQQSSATCNVPAAICYDAASVGQQQCCFMMLLQ